MDDVREQQQLADEISQAISNPTIFGQEVDDDELLKELEDMEQEEIERKLMDTEPLPKLPEVPSGVPKEQIIAGRKTIVFKFVLFHLNRIKLILFILFFFFLIYE